MLVRQALRERGALEELDRDVSVVVEVEAAVKTRQYWRALVSNEDLLLVHEPVARVSAVLIDTDVVPRFLQQAEASRGGAQIDGAEHPSTDPLRQPFDDEVSPVEQVTPLWARNIHAGALERIVDPRRRRQVVMQTEIVGQTAGRVQQVVGAVCLVAYRRFRPFVHGAVPVVDEASGFEGPVGGDPRAPPATRGTVERHRQSDRLSAVARVDGDVLADLRHAEMAGVEQGEQLDRIHDLEARAFVEQHVERRVEHWNSGERSGRYVQLPALGKHGTGAE